MRISMNGTNLPWLLQDSYALPIRHASSNFDVMSFVDRIVMKHPNKHILLRRLSDIHILIGGDDVLLNKGEKTWSELAPSTDINAVPHVGRCPVLAWMLLDDYPQDGVFVIDLIDSLVSGLNAAALLINRVERSKDCSIFPGEAIFESRGYWEKWLEHTIPADKVNSVPSLQNKKSETVRDRLDPETMARLSYFKNINWLDWEVLDNTDDGTDDGTGDGTDDGIEIPPATRPRLAHSLN